MPVWLLPSSSASGFAGSFGSTGSVGMRKPPGCVAGRERPAISSSTAYDTGRDGFVGRFGRSLFRRIDGAVAGVGVLGRPAAHLVVRVIVRKQGAGRFLAHEETSLVGRQPGAAGDFVLYCL